MGSGMRRRYAMRFAEYGPVPLEMVVEYLKALEKMAIVEQVK